MMKQIVVYTLFALLMIGCGSSDSEPQKTEHTQEVQEKVVKKMFSFPVIKQEIDGLSQRLLELDQATFDFDSTDQEVTLKFKKIADFSGGYTPRIDHIAISSISSKDNEECLMIKATSYERVKALNSLNELLKKPVGSTAEVTLPLELVITAEELKRANIKGMAITELVVNNQADYNELVDFVMELKNISAAGDNKKFKQMIYPNHKFPKGSYLAFASINDYGPFDEFPIDDNYMKNITREKLNAGYVLVEENTKEGKINDFTLHYDAEIKCYILLHSIRRINITDEEEAVENEGTILYMTKINGKYKIVNIIFVG